MRLWKASELIYGESRFSSQILIAWSHWTIRNPWSLFGPTKLESSFFYSTLKSNFRRHSKKTENDLNVLFFFFPEWLQDICCSDSLAEVDLFSLINDNLPLYKLRADTLFTHSNSDWIEAPLYVDEQEISELTNEQIKYTLDYFCRNSTFTRPWIDCNRNNLFLAFKCWVASEWVKWLRLTMISAQSTNY